MVRENWGHPRIRGRGMRGRLSQLFSRKRTGRGQCITPHSCVVLRCLDSQSWCFRNKSRVPADRHPPAAQCERRKAPGRSTVLPGASCPIFCTRAALHWCAAMRVGQEQLHIQPATGPRETSLNHALIHTQIQSYGYH